MNIDRARLRTGELLEWQADIQGVRIELLAEVEVTGALVHLRSLAIYPVGTEQADIGVAELLRAARAGLFPALRAAGFTRLRVSAIRLSGSLPGRIVDLTIDLERQAR